MKIIKAAINKELHYFLHDDSNLRSDINPKTGKFSCFIYGKGHFTVSPKKFEILQGVEMPDRWADLTWLEIAKIFDKYGIHVANEYGSRKTAGIVSRQTIYGYSFIYSKIKNQLWEGFDPRFFELLRCDYFLSCVGLFLFDISALDKGFSKSDPEYNGEKCTYKGKPCSMMEYVVLKHGLPYVTLINTIIETEFQKEEAEVLNKVAA